MIDLLFYQVIQYCKIQKAVAKNFHLATAFSLIYDCAFT